MWNTFQARYKVVKKIGEGSFSEVLQCEDRMTGAQVAAKRLKKTYKSNEEILNCAELIASEKIRCHPNVLNLKEYFYDTFAGKIIFIFDLMDLSMYDYIKQRTRSVPEYRVKRFLFQMLRGLDHLHRHGLFHRDIKPENILLKLQSLSPPLGPEMIKIADLGSVRGTYSSPPYTEYISTRWYRSPECLLTVGYYGPKMDVWASGCVFYEMLTLKPLFAGRNEVDQLHKIHEVLGVPSITVLRKLKNKSMNFMQFRAVKPRGLDSLTGEFTEEARRLLKMMLQYDPDKRINVGRLLNNDYFAEFRYPRTAMRESSIVRHSNPADGCNTRKSHHLKPETEVNLLNLSKEKLMKQRHSEELKRILQASTKDSKENAKELNRCRMHPLAPKTPVDLIRCTTLPKPANYKLRDASKPLVDSKSLKSWGVNPNILRAVDPNHSYLEAIKVKPRVQRKVSTDKFRKTTSYGMLNSPNKDETVLSMLDEGCGDEPMIDEIDERKTLWSFCNLPQLTNPLLQPKEMKFRGFQSQSLVAPWYGPGSNDKTNRVKLETYKRSQIKRKLIRGT